MTNWVYASHKQTYCRTWRFNKLAKCGYEAGQNPNGSLWNSPATGDEKVKVSRKVH